jgi:hypothetical protein
MRRLPDEKHFARKAKWKQRGRKQKQKDGQEDCYECSGGKAWRCCKVRCGI